MDGFQFETLKLSGPEAHREAFKLQLQLASTGGGQI